MIKKLVLTTLLVLTILFSVSSQLSAQWVSVSGGIANRDVQCITSSGNYLFAGLLNYNGIYYSSNNGANWILRGLSTNHIYSLASNDTYIYAGLDTEICHSSDFGITWTRKGIPDLTPVISIAASGNNIMLSAQNLGTSTIYYSSNNGSNWSVSAGITGGSTRITTFQNHFYVSSGSPPFTLKHSSNFGLNWTSSTIWPLGKPLCIQSFSNYVYAGTSKYDTHDSLCGLCISSDYGNTWTIAGLTQKNITAIAVSGNNVIAGTKDSGIYISTNNGLVWIKKNEGLTSVNTTNVLYIFNNYVYAGIANQAVWRRPLTELIIGVNNSTSLVPTSFALEQNYPNPFNPVTNIRYQIPNDKYVTIKVYNLIGKEIAALVNEKKTPGIYNVNFDANNLSSGIYFYSLYTDGVKINTKRMVLIK